MANEQPKLDYATRESLPPNPGCVATGVALLSGSLAVLAAFVCFLLTLGKLLFDPSPDRWTQFLLLIAAAIASYAAFFLFRFAAGPGPGANPDRSWDDRR